MIRTEALTTLKRWRELAGAAGVGALGAWLIWLGGWLLTPVGVAFVALAAGWGVIALRRIRFTRAVSAPGVVEVDEGQVGYLGPPSAASSRCANWSTCGWSACRARHSGG